MDIPRLPDVLAPGDRMPNFARPDAAGRPFVYYNACCGRPQVLALALAPESPAVAAAAAGLRELPPDSALLLLRGDPDGARSFAADHGLACPVLADDGELARFLVGPEGVDQSPLAVLALDANAHLRRRWDVWPGAEAVAGCLAAPDDGPVLRRAAPALLVPRVFEAAFCRHLIGAYAADNEPSGVLQEVEGRMVYVADEHTKIRREHRIEAPALKQAVADRLQRRLLPEIRWAFNYAVTRYEAFKVVSYDAASGGYFRVHRDNDGPDTAHRRFALTLNLNSADYEGGELRFPEYGPERYKPDAGGAVVFSCSLAHEALPVTRGVRYALLSFLYGEDSQVQQVQREDRVTR